MAEKTSTTCTSRLSFAGDPPKGTATFLSTTFNVPVHSYESQHGILPKVTATLPSQAAVLTFPFDIHPTEKKSKNNSPDRHNARIWRGEAERTVWEDVRRVEQGLPPRATPRRAEWTPGLSPFMTACKPFMQIVVPFMKAIVTCMVAFMHL